jgi:formylglycine-generating enzyme required for sulfatase activity
MRQPMMRALFGLIVSVSAVGCSSGGGGGGGGGGGPVPSDDNSNANGRGPADLNALDLGSGVSLKLIVIPAGTFQMGSPANEAGRTRSKGPSTRCSSPHFEWRRLR